MEAKKEQGNIFEQTIASREHGHRWRLHLDIEAGLFLFLIGVVIFVRFTDLYENTLFVDEAIYATVGEEVLAGVFGQAATAWMFGSYLYPVLAATASYFGGVVGLRALSTILSTITTTFVFLTALRLFDRQSALWAMLVFGLTGISISLGQIAVIDTLSVTFLVITVYLLISTSLNATLNQNRYLLAAAVTFSLSVLSKYIALFYLPALILLVFIPYISQRRPVRPLFTTFLAFSALILGAYILYYRQDLMDMLGLSRVYSFQPSNRWVIAKLIWEEVGIVIIVAFAGMLLLSKASIGSPGYRTGWVIFLAAILIPFLTLALLAVPVYHLVQENIRSLWKHLVYSLIFLSPLAGYGLASIVRYYRSYRGRWATYYRAVGTVITIACLIWFVEYSLDRNWGLRHSWPNVSGVIEYLESEGLTKDSHVLAEGAQIYEYYFDFGVNDRDTWDNTWYLEYEGQQGAAAMTAAITNHKFDFVVLDGYHNPGITPDLETASIMAGYTLGYEESQKLSAGENIYLRVYVLPEYAQRGN